MAYKTTYRATPNATLTVGYKVVCYNYLTDYGHTTTTYWAFVANYYMIRTMFPA